MSGTLNTTEYVGSGLGNSASDSSTTIVSGGIQYVGYDYGTGSATNTTILNGGVQVVGDDYGTGSATSTTIDSGGEQIVGYGSGATGTATSTTIISGGVQFVGDDFGTASATSTAIDSGGTQFVGGNLGTGTATSTTISGGTQYVGENLRGIGTATSTTIDGGGVQYVGYSSGTGTASGTTINAGTQYVGDYLAGIGTATSTTIDSGGYQIVGLAYGTGYATSTTINSGGVQYVGYSSGTGTATSTNISGGEQVVSSGGTATDTIAYSGGLADVLSGGVANAPVIDGGTLKLEHGASVGVGGIDFAADTNWGTLDLTGEGSGLTLSTPISNFTGTGGTTSTSDVIDVTGTGAGDQLVWTQGTATQGTLDVMNGGTVLETLTFDGTYHQSQFVLTSAASTDQITYDTSIACYLAATRIATADGEVAVEDLKIGDRLLTAFGALRPIKWIGHRSIDITKHPDPRSVWPICVLAGAFGENAPSRGLWLSPGHNIAAEGVLMPISVLQNSVTVVQHERATVEYWHVELDEHDIILAEGLPAESYLDTGNRTDFVNGGPFIEAHPDFKPKWWRETCLPLVQEGIEVTRTKEALLERIKELGYVRTSEADIHLMADGKRIDPVELSAWRFAFVLPTGCDDIRLMSRTFIPAAMLADNADTRSLGVCVRRLQIDGEDIVLDDTAQFREGWYDLEPGQRWTQGSAPLPARSRVIIIDLAGHGCYWAEPRNNVAALFG